MAEDGCEAVRFSPVVAVEIAENDDTIFATLWVAVFIFLDLGDCHGWEGFAGDVTEATIFVFGDDLPCVEFKEAIDFFEVGVIPEFAIVWVEHVVAE